MDQKEAKVNQAIDKIETTSSCLTGRKGMMFVSRFLRTVGILELLEKTFYFTRENKKGAPLKTIFHQILCYFFDDISLSLTRFDQLKMDNDEALVR